MNKRLKKKRIAKFKVWLKNNNIFFFDAKQLRKAGYKSFDFNEIIKELKKAEYKSNENIKEYWKLTNYKESILNSLPINQKILLSNEMNKWINIGISKKEYKNFKKKRFISILTKDYIFGLQFFNSGNKFAWQLDTNLIAVI